VIEEFKLKVDSKAEYSALLSSTRSR